MASGSIGPPNQFANLGSLVYRDNGKEHGNYFLEQILGCTRVMEEKWETPL